MSTTDEHWITTINTVSAVCSCGVIIVDLSNATEQVEPYDQDDDPPAPPTTEQYDNLIAGWREHTTERNAS